MNEIWKCSNCGVFNYPSQSTCSKCHKPFGFRGAARRTDPDTSHAAAASVNATELEALVLGLIEKFPEGCIADDVLESAPNHRSNTLTPRFGPLLKKGLIVDTGERRKGLSGKSQRVVIAAKYVKP